MDWSTTTTILHDLRHDEGVAWERFVQRFRRPVAHFARQMGCSATDAEDVAQETFIAFLKAYRAGRYDRTRGRLSRWLFGIAYRQALRGRAGARDMTRPEAEAARRDEAAALWERQWEQAVLSTCLARVRAEVEERTYLAFEMVVLRGKSALEAAVTLGVPVKTVYNAKHRVLRRIRLARNEIEEP